MTDKAFFSSSQEPAILCLSSSDEDDDDDDDDLLNGSFLTRRRPGEPPHQRGTAPASYHQPTIVTDGSNNNNNSGSSSGCRQEEEETLYHKSPTISNDHDDESLFQKVVRRSQQSAYHDDEDSDDDGVLEFVPSTSNPSTTAAAAAASEGGQDAEDSLDLTLSPIPPSPRERLRTRLNEQNAKREEQTSPLLRSAAPASSAAAAADTVLAASRSSSSEESQPFDAKPAAAVTTRPRSDGGDSGSSGSDDDSFTAQCRRVRVNRQKRARRIEPAAVTTAARSTVSEKKRQRSTASGDDDEDRKNRSRLRSAEKRVRQEKKQALRAQKERDKEAARERKRCEKVAKQQAAAAAKQQREQDKKASNQSRGKFANQEIGILVEPTLLDIHNPASAWKVQDTLSEAGFVHVHPYPSGLSCHAVQFIRQEYLRGGATHAIADLMQTGPPRPGQAVGYEHSSLLAIVVEAHALIELIQADDDDHDNLPRGFSEDDDYPKLEQWLFGLVAGWRAAWHKTAADRPRIILLLYQVPELLDRTWVQYNRNQRRGPTPPNTEQLHDAILWMLIQFQVESIHCRTPEDVGHEIFKMTRLLAETPYVKQATDLQTFAKLPAHVSDMAPSFDRARDAWIRQLQQIPRVSADMAHEVSRHYPTALSLWKAYHDDDLSEYDKQIMLADCFGTRSTQVKLSNHVYRALTSDNPQEILS